MKIVSLRPEVAAFAQLMERQLQAQDPERGSWRDREPDDLFNRLDGQVMRLRDALFGITGAGSPLTRTVNVANYAMMLADVLGGLPSQEGF